MLPTVTPVDPAWLDISAQRERFKLCFANGYWDCSEDRFYEGSIPEHRFLSGVRAPLQPRDQRYVDLVHHGAGGDVQASLQQHGGARLHAQGTGAALAGDQAANYFVLGDSNTGKGVLTRFLELTFPGVVAQFNASHLGAESSNDPAKDDQLQWVVPVFHSSIVVSNEFNLRARAAGGRTERARINSKI